MKKIMALGAAVVIMGAAVMSCDNPFSDNIRDKLGDLRDRSDNTRPDSGSRPDIADGDKSQTGFEVQYIRTASVGYPGTEPVVISSRVELEQYGSYIPNHHISGDGVRSNGFTAPTAKYTDGFFADNFLVIVPKTEGSGSIRHNVDSVDVGGNIYITRILPGGGSADIAAWHIIIELDNSSKLSAYNAVFTDNAPIQPPPLPPVLSYSAEADYVRLGYVERRGETPVVISSTEELDRYAISTQNGAGRIGLAAPEYGIRDEYYEYSPVVKKYPDSFFTGNFLVIVPRTEPSGSIRHNFERVDADGNIFIDRIWPCADCAHTADVVSWDIVIPLPKDGNFGPLKEYYVTVTDFTNEGSELVKK